jgi:predicted LPLAT superfamily acyltransferase
MAEKKEWKGKSRGGAFGYKIFIFFLKHFGIRFAYFILIFVAAYFVVFAPSATRASFRYLRKIIGFPFLKSCWYVYLSYYRFGQTLLDKVAILAGLKTNFTFYFDGEENLRALAKENKGAILISAHMGNWEIAGHFLKKLNTPINIVMYDGEDAGIKEILEKSMSKRKFKVIYIQEDFSHLLQIHKALQNNEFICIHGDRFVKSQRGKVEQAEFMGRPASFPRGPFELATRLKVPYTFVYAVKETNTHYHFYATPGKDPSVGAKVILDEYLRSLEKILWDFPEQWFNYYMFWDDYGDGKENT